MKKIVFIIISLSLQFLSFGQKHTRYYANGPEFIFSGSDFSNPDIDSKPVVRFSGFYNWGFFKHNNFTPHFGMLSGIEVRNIGIINSFSKTPNSEEFKLKQRAYTIGIPIGLKLGNMDKLTFLYGGVSFDLALTYKEKKIVDGEKQYTKTAWFSKKINTFLPSAFLGFQFKTGHTISMRYYIKNFLNTSYTENNVRIYEGTQSHIFNLSVSLLLYNIRKSVIVEKRPTTTTAKNM